MTRMLCEIHLTFHVDQAEKVEALQHDRGWKFSKIMGDPVLGNKPFCYLTTYASDVAEAFGRITEAREYYEGQHSCRVLREKIELIVYDNRREGKPS